MFRRTERRRRKRQRKIRSKRYQASDLGAASNDILDDILSDNLKPYKCFIWMHFLDNF